ncbi:MAG TPA: hypothetical protein VJN22_08250 [Candidatus Eremiobacteraceae bacterium]|nr:hypothetical protein [Candidatus Eremiobacteraceae bacterium]
MRSMRVRLRLLLTSFNRAIAEYVLARLELGMVNPDAVSAPVIARLGAYLPLDDGFRDSWPLANVQVRAALAYLEDVERGRVQIGRSAARERFAYAVRQVAQYASGIDWLQGAGGRAARQDPAS